MRNPRGLGSGGSPPNGTRLLQVNNDRNSQTAHFYNPHGRSPGASTVSNRFQEGDVKNVSTGKGSIKKISKKKRVDPTSTPERRGSTRVRVSSFFSMFSPKKGVETSLRQPKKKGGIKGMFGFGKKKKPKVRDDIYEDVDPPNFETLDIDFNNHPIDPRQHMRNTPQFFVSARSHQTNQTEDTGIFSDQMEEQPAQVNSQSGKLDLFEIDKIRKSRKDRSEQSPTLVPPPRTEVISFMGSGKVVGPANRTTIQGNTLPRRNGSLHYDEEDENPFSTLPRGNTVYGDDLNSTPPAVPERIPSKKLSEPLSRSSDFSPGPTQLLQSRQSYQVSNSEGHRSQNVTLAPPPRTVQSGIWSVDENVANVLASQSTLKRKKKERMSVQTFHSQNSRDDRRPNNPTVAPPRGVQSGIWSVDENVANVLASAATLKRKKKSQARSSPDVKDGTTRTEYSDGRSQAQDSELLDILSGPKATARKKRASFSSFQSFEPNPNV